VRLRGRVAVFLAARRGGLDTLVLLDVAPPLLVPAIRRQVVLVQVVLEMPAANGKKATVSVNASLSSHSTGSILASLGMIPICFM
jgi:hypothetical protein